MLKVALKHHDSNPKPLHFTQKWIERLYLDDDLFKTFPWYIKLVYSSLTWVCVCLDGVCGGGVSLVLCCTKCIRHLDYPPPTPKKIICTLNWNILKFEHKNYQFHIYSMFYVIFKILKIMTFRFIMAMKKNLQLSSL